MTNEICANGQKNTPTSNRGVRNQKEQEKSFLLVGKDRHDREIECVLTANVDWLTVTTSNEKRGQDWLALFHEVSKKENDGKIIFETKSWKALGYKGYSIGQLRYGYSSRSGYIAIASGALTPILWKQLVGQPVKVTRIDLACTLRLTCEMKGLARNYYQTILDKKEDGEGLGNRNYLLMQNSREGETLYVGSPKSEQYGRLYDKGVQTGDAPPGFLWRYEVEYKKPSSDKIAEALVATREKEAQQISATVYDWFGRREIKPVFKREGDAIRIETSAIITSLDKKVSWLRQQVRPTVATLIAGGRSDDAMEALGLAGYEFNDGKEF